MKNWYAVEVCRILLPALASVWIRSGIECLTFDRRLSRCESLWSSYPIPSLSFGPERRKWKTPRQVDGGLVLWIGLADVSTSYTIIGGVVAGAGWYLYRLARGPEGRSFYTLVVAFFFRELMPDIPFRAFGL